MPYFFPHPGLLGTLAPAPPAATWARTGLFAFDTMTLIGPGTWEAARGAADAALTAAELVLDGAPAAYACCRPPGHHVTRSAYGGCCYLNNGAIAAARLRAALDAPVAVLDVDAHHGNGAQSIFYDSAGVVTGSVHVDPGAGWFPHFLGFAGERRRAREPQRRARARQRRRAVARRGGRARALGARLRAARARGRARRRRRGRRCGEPAARDRRRLPRGRPRAGEPGPAHRRGAGGRLRPGGDRRAGARVARRARARAWRRPRVAEPALALGRARRVRGDPVAAAQGRRGAAALAAGGDRRDRAAALADARRRPAPRGVHPGRRHVRRVAARPRRAAPGAACA